MTGGTAAVVLAVGGRQRTSAQNQVLNLYSARHYNTDNALYTDFTKETGIKVNLVEGKADALIKRIETEKNNANRADILLTVDAGNLWQAEKAQLFQPISSSALESRIPANLRHPQGLWFGFSTRARVIIYNRDLVNPARLSTYVNLAAPDWRKKILIRPSSNIYNQSLVASRIAELGEPATKDWLAGLMANLARPPQGNDTGQIKACAAGLGSLAIANHYYYARLLASSNATDKAIVKKVGIFFPNQREQGTHFNVSGGGVLANAPHKVAAVKFLEYLSTPKAQAYFADGNYEYPVVSGTQLSPVLKQIGRFKVDPINVSVYGQNQRRAIELMDEAGWA